MSQFLAAAGPSGDLALGCRAAGVTFAEYRRARGLDPAFDVACGSLDEARRFALVDSIEAQAAEGKLPAVKFLMANRAALAELTGGGSRGPTAAVLAWAREGEDAGRAIVIDPRGRFALAVEPEHAGRAPALAELVGAALVAGLDLIELGTVGALALAEALAGMRCPGCLALQGGHAAGAYGFDLATPEGRRWESERTAARLIDLAELEPELPPDPHGPRRGVSADHAAALDSLATGEDPGDAPPSSWGPWICCARGCKAPVGAADDDANRCASCGAADGYRRDDTAAKKHRDDQLRARLGPPPADGVPGELALSLLPWHCTGCGSATITAVPLCHCGSNKGHRAPANPDQLQSGEAARRRAMAALGARTAHPRSLA